MNIVNRKRLLVIILLVALIILVIIAGWLFINKRFSQRSSQNLLPPYTTFPVTTSSPPNIKVSSTTEMKMYSNTEFGFEFQYPEDWSFQLNSFYSLFSRFNLILERDFKNYNPFNPSFIINIVTPDFAERSFYDLKSNILEASVGGVTGLKYEYEYEGLSKIAIILPLGQYKMIIGMNKEYENVFNQILSTFKFLKWKTYKNDQYGFEYQYPPNLVFKEINFPIYTFVDSGEVCKNLLEEESKPRRLLNETTLVDPSSKFKVIVVTVDIYDNADNLSLDEWLNSGTKFLEEYREECQYDDKNYIEISLSNKKDVIVDNVTGIQGFSGCCMVSNKNIYLAKNDKIYNLTFSGDVNDSPTGKCMDNLNPFADNKYSCPYISEDIYNQIISSFKFLK